MNGFGWILLAVLTLLVVSNAHATAVNVPCNGIWTVDFRNTTIHIGSRTFAFHHGVALEYEHRDNGPAVVMWRARLEEEINIQAASKVAIRFLLIHDFHVTGSGWRFYLVGYRCRAGSLKEVFERDGLSLKIDRLDSAGLVLSVIPFHDAVSRKHFSYVWSGSMYVLNSAWTK